MLKGGRVPDRIARWQMRFSQFYLEYFLFPGENWPNHARTLVKKNPTTAHRQHSRHSHYHLLLPPSLLPTLLLFRKGWSINGYMLDVLRGE